VTNHPALQNRLDHDQHLRWAREAQRRAKLHFVVREVPLLTAGSRQAGASRRKKNLYSAVGVGALRQRVLTTPPPRASRNRSSCRRRAYQNSIARDCALRASCAEASSCSMRTTEPWSGRSATTRPHSLPRGVGKAGAHKLSTTICSRLRPDADAPTLEAPWTKENARGAEHPYKAERAIANTIRCQPAPRTAPSARSGLTKTSTRGSTSKSDRTSLAPV
jgi:hypothetical protein